MRKSNLKKTVAGALASLMCALSVPAVPTAVYNTAYAAQSFTVNSSQQQFRDDNVDGYSYEIWLDRTGGSGSMTLGSGGAFDTQWSAEVSQGNFLARRGKNYDRTRKATDCGNIVMDYAAQYSASAKGNSRLCVYGWFVDPLVEYYIIEDWVNWCPSGQSKTVTIDGAQYDIFQTTHTGPTILGDTRTFPQYFSVRKQKRTSGTITVSDHFKAWANAGMSIGNLTEVALNVEGWESSGRANVTKLTISDKLPDPTTTSGDTPAITTTTKAVEPDANGYYFNDTFESGKGSWRGRGEASAAIDNDNSAEGKSSLFVSGRTDNWNGAEMELDPAAFIPGKTYSFGAAVMQNTESSTAMKMTLQYTDASGTEQYDEVASAAASNGKWTALGNPSYTIPEGASNMYLYVEAPESLTDFYIDNVMAAVKGKEATFKNTTTTTTTTSSITPSTDVTLWGDANEDKNVDMSDAVMIMQSLANPSKYKMTKQGSANGDVNAAGNGITNADALAVQKYLVGSIDKLPESYSDDWSSPDASRSNYQYNQGGGLVSYTQRTIPPETIVSTTTAAATTAKVNPSEISGKSYKVFNGENQHKDVEKDGYSYEIWLDRTGGEGSMVVGDNGTFTTEWNAEVSQGNFLARRGKDFDRSKKATDYGKIEMDYEAEYSAGTKGNSRLCIYGWMVDPLVEYYIIEDWVNWRPTANGYAKTVTIDGAQYEIFPLDHSGPTILGDTRTFKQYFSVRQQKRTSGTVTISDHFKAWADAGWEIGNLTEAALNVEGWESSGSAEVSKLQIRIGSPSDTEENNSVKVTSPVNTNTSDNSGEFTPFKYEANKQYKAAPDYYYNACRQQGKVTKETYNGIRGSKTLNVYTPYNYDPSKKYNIFYLMHGGGENENTLFYQNDTMIQNLLDNMIMNGELEPLIVVTPTFNGSGSEAGNFYEELRQSVIPFVEGKYSTYAKSTSAADIAASRMHRAYGGFSMGAVSTWAVIQNDLDIVGYFMPLSGDHWQGQGAYNKAKSIADAVDKSGLKPNQYFIFAATGSNDIAYPNVNPQIDEMKKMSQFKFTSDFSQGNFYFMVAQGNEHWWGQVRNYVYDALPYFFHESGN